MSECIPRIVLLLLLLGALLACRCSAVQPDNEPPPGEDDDIEYEDLPPTMFGERLYGLVVAFVNGYVTGVQDIIDTAIKPFMYVVEKFTEQLDQ